MAEYYIGLISGTSADGIDAALVDTAGERPILVDSYAHPYPDALRTEILALMQPGENEIDRFGEVDQQVGQVFAEAAQILCQQAQLKPGDIVAIGSHGQTIRHRPSNQVKHPFTLQIGDPNQIAERTGITTVADFRRRDMAAGGQGAPLAPAIHRAAFYSPLCQRVVVNIGGIGNVTHLPVDGDVIGFDTGPGNGIMDQWILRHQGQAFDRNGAWGAGGQVHTELLQAMLGYEYFQQPFPKSTGREEFHLAWLENYLNQFPDITPVDVQATLLELTATTIANDIRRVSGNDQVEVFICGGGAHSEPLMQTLSRKLDLPVSSTAALGIAPDWVEATCFAWLAKRTLAKQAGNIASVTGAKADKILGAIYW